MSNLQKARRKRLIMVISTLVIGVSLAALLINIFTGGGLISSFKTTTVEKKVSDVFLEPVTVKTKNYSVTLYKGTYVFSNTKNKECSFSGEYKLYSISKDDKRITVENREKYKKFYLLKCYYDTHSMGNELEFYNGEKEYTFDFILAQTKDNKYKVFNNFDFKNVMFNENFF